MMSNSPVDAMQHLYDIYDLRHVPWWQASWVYYVLAVWALLFFLGIGWYVTRKIMARRVYTPWEKALMELDLLRTQGFVSVVYSKEFYTALTRLLKVYVHERYGFDVLGKTDEEVVALLEKSSFSTDLVQPLQTIFKGSVSIKFANSQAIKTQIEQDFSASRVIICKTIPMKNA